MNGQTQNFSPLISNIYKVVQVQGRILSGDEFHLPILLRLPCTRFYQMVHIFSSSNFHIVRDYNVVIL